MADNVKVTTIGDGAKYAKVADRELAFRGKFPNGKITTEISRDDDNKTTARAWIWKDKADLMEFTKIAIEKGTEISPAIIRETADANGTADFVKSGDKQTEKLETVAIGRALAHLGFAADGNVATSEEMELFHEYQEQQFRAKCDEAVKRLLNSKSIDELAAVWRELAKNNPKVVADPQVLNFKNAAKKAFEMKNLEGEK